MRFDETARNGKAKPETTGLATVAAIEFFKQASPSSPSESQGRDRSPRPPAAPFVVFGINLDGRLRRRYDWPALASSLATACSINA